MGVTWEHDLHLLQRRAKHCQLALGAPESCLAEIAEDLLANARAGVRSAERGMAQSGPEPQDQAFVDELRDWLDRHATPERLKEVNEGGLAARRAWQAEMAEGGWVGVHWPVAYGGRDATFTQQVLYHAELTARGLPRLPGNRGLTIVAPTLVKHGTPFQQKLLEPTRRADVLWSTAFSEPGAGSDLAGLQTRGVIDGEDLVITGTKIWTSDAHYTDWLYMLVRTGPQHPKHDGISCVILPLKIDGLTVRPIRLNNGRHQFNQLFFDEVRVPLTHVVGPINEGWRKVNRTTMAHEHFTNFLGTHASYANVIEHILRRLSEREAGGRVDHDLRRRAAMSWITVQLLRLNGLRNVVRIQSGEDPGAEGSIQKVLGQEEERRLFELALDVMGTAGLANGRWGRAYLSARAATIGGGTSEIHRNKLAERVLGLPRDLWADDVIATEGG
jgi:alkylation response protein AidB-like acyl-CoA dehydrogenase